MKLVLVDSPKPVRKKNDIVCMGSSIVATAVTHTPIARKTSDIIAFAILSKQLATSLDVNAHAVLLWRGWRLSLIHI